MIPWEDLSRLLASDLPEAEAEALKARISAEPEVAAAYAQLQSLQGELADLDDPAPPPALDVAVLDGLTEGPRGVGGAWKVAAVSGWLAAAAAGLVAVWPATPVQPVSIEVDGHANVGVVPEEDGMKAIAASSVVGALAGAMLTVSVYEGTATVSQDGQTRTLQANAPSLAVNEPGVLLESEPDQVRSLKKQVADLKKQLAVTRLEGVLTKGALQAHEGTPQPWPDGLPPQFSPAGFESAVRDALLPEDGVVVETFDCTEFPCIALLRRVDPVEGEDWDARTLADAVVDNLGGGAISVNRANMDDDEGLVQLMAISAVPKDQREALGQRTEYRTRALMEAQSPEGP